MAQQPNKRQAGRWTFVIAAVLTIVVGLASRHVAWVPTWVGDALWATNAYFVISAIAPGAARWRRGAAALAISYAVEVSQLYHQPWIDDIRRTTLGHLLLGSSFTWTDLIAYTAGVALGLAATRQRTDAPTRTPIRPPDEQPGRTVGRPDTAPH